MHLINTGVPHAVLFVPDVTTIDLAEAIPIRHQFNANVNYATLQTDGSIAVRTYERGLEGESLACGTGAAAVAFIAAQKWKLKSPIQMVFPGGKLLIEMKENRCLLIAEALRVYEGVLKISPIASSAERRLHRSINPLTHRLKCFFRIRFYFLDFIS